MQERKKENNSKKVQKTGLGPAKMKNCRLYSMA